jgi:hypothetical protein
MPRLNTRLDFGKIALTPGVLPHKELPKELEPDEPPKRERSRRFFGFYFCGCTNESSLDDVNVSGILDIEDATEFSDARNADAASISPDMSSGRHARAVTGGCMGLWLNCGGDAQIPVACWSKKEVASWLEGFGLGHCSSIFVANHVNGEVLLQDSFNQATLETIGITLESDRRVILQQREILRQQHHSSVSVL